MKWDLVARAIRRPPSLPLDSITAPHHTLITWDKKGPIQTLGDRLQGTGGYAISASRIPYTVALFHPPQSQRQAREETLRLGPVPPFDEYVLDDPENPTADWGGLVSAASWHVRSVRPGHTVWGPNGKLAYDALMSLRDRLPWNTEDAEDAAVHLLLGIRDAANGCVGDAETRLQYLRQDAVAHARLEALGLERTVRQWVSQMRFVNIPYYVLAHDPDDCLDILTVALQWTAAHGKTSLIDPVVQLYRMGVVPEVNGNHVNCWQSKGNILTVQVTPRAAVSWRRGAPGEERVDAWMSITEQPSVLLRFPSSEHLNLPSETAQTTDPIPAYPQAHYAIIAHPLSDDETLRTEGDRLTGNGRHLIEAFHGWPIGRPELARFWSCGGELWGVPKVLQPFGIYVLDDPERPRKGEDGAIRAISWHIHSVHPGHAIWGSNGEIIGDALRRLNDPIPWETEAAEDAALRVLTGIREATGNGEFDWNAASRLYGLHQDEVSLIPQDVCAMAAAAPWELQADLSNGLNYFGLYRSPRILMCAIQWTALHGNSELMDAIVQLYRMGAVPWVTGNQVVCWKAKQEILAVEVTPTGALAWREGPGGEPIHLPGGPPSPPDHDAHSL